MASIRLANIAGTQVACEEGQQFSLHCAHVPSFDSIEGQATSHPGPEVQWHSGGGSLLAKASNSEQGKQDSWCKGWLTAMSVSLYKHSCRFRAEVSSAGPRTRLE